MPYDAVPEWFVHNDKGEPQEFNGTYQACVNGDWARDYSLRILREGLERYDLDAAFFNMTGYQPYDYSNRYRGIGHCSNCRQGFGDMFGRSLPAKEDFSDPGYADYLEFKRQTSLAAGQRIYDTVKAIRASTGVMGNGKTACDFIRLEIQRAVSRPAPEWPHQPGELTRWGEAIGRGRAYSCASTNFLDYQWRYASETAHNHLLRFRPADRGRRTDLLLFARHVRSAQPGAARRGARVPRMARGGWRASRDDAVGRARGAVPLARFRPALRLHAFGQYSQDRVQGGLPCSAGIAHPVRLRQRRAHEGRVPSGSRNMRSFSCPTMPASAMRRGRRSMHG